MFDGIGYAIWGLVGCCVFLAILCVALGLISLDWISWQTGGITLLALVVLALVFTIGAEMGGR